MKFLTLIAVAFCFSLPAFSQEDTSRLRIKNFNPYFNVHIDSALRYKFDINKTPSDYYWFLKNSPAGLRIGKDDGMLSLNINKSYFLSGRLKYDYQYKVLMSVQNLNNPTERIDTSFTIQFYSTEIIQTKLKPSTANKINAEEGDTISFAIQCGTGSFPIDAITYYSNYPIKSSTPVVKCGDIFTWGIPFDFIKEADKDKQKNVQVYFIGSSKYNTADTAFIEVLVKANINYPLQVQEYNAVREDIAKYILQLKGSFKIVDSRVKKTKSTRTAFELATASTALGGTVFSSLPGESQKTTGKILPSVGVALVPVKEATAPNNAYEQNSATLIRSNIKRLEYLLADTRLVGERDPEIITKTKKLTSELTQTQIQLLDVPVADIPQDPKELDEYFNSPKVNKKYKMRKK